MNLIAIITLTVTYGGGFDAGDRILIYWDGSAFIVYLEDNPGGVQNIIVTGPNLGNLDASQVSGVTFPREPIRGEKNPNKSNYQYCDGTNLIQFPFSTQSPDFPYTFQYTSVNDAACQITPIVCDVHFTAEPVITGAASSFTTEGEVQLAAASSHGTVKYSTYNPSVSLGQFDNVTNTTGLFTGLHSGIYTFYAVDQYNCFSSIDVVIPVLEPLTYNTKYRLQYYDIMTHAQTIADIKERGYTGDIIDVQGTGDPVVISKNNGELNNKFDVIRPTFADFNLNSERHFQFIGLYSQDDAKYKKQFDHAGRSWQGFLSPSVYSEGYSASTNYPVNLKFGDNLALLNQYDFLDESGNQILTDRTLLEIITIILKKTGLQLDILSGVNKYAEDMSTGAADDPLDQTFIECVCFYDENSVPLKCDEVLQAILKPFGAAIIQSDSKWNIIEVDGQCAPYNYRLFDYLGVYQSNGTIDPLIRIDRPSITLENVLFTGDDHALEIIPAYGKISVNQILKPRASIFPLSMDLWGVNSSAAGTSLYNTYIPIEGKKYKGVQVNGFSRSPTFETNTFMRITSPSFDIIALSDGIEFGFQYKVSLPGDLDTYGNYYRNKGPHWIRIIYELSLTIGSDVYYFFEGRGWSQDAPYRQNYIYVTEFLGEDASFTKTIDLPQITPSSLISLQASFILEGAYYKDFLSLADFHALATIDLPVGSKVRGNISHSDWAFLSGSTNILYYELTSGTDAESNPASEYPSIIRPTDYNASTNPVVWRWSENNDSRSTGFSGPIDNVALYNVFMRYLPNRQKPVENKEVSLVNNVSYKENLDYEITTGDFPPELLNKELYTNIFKLSDGTPTKNWARTDTAEIDYIGRLLLKSIGNQYAKPTWRLSGSYLGPDISFVNIIKHTIAAFPFSITNPDNPGLYLVGASPAGQAWSTDTVVFDGTHMGNSTYMRQPQELIPGSRIRIDFKITRTGTAGTTRIDRFVAVIFSGSLVVQKVVLSDGLSYDTVIDQAVSFNLDSSGDKIGFFIENITGDGGSATYVVDYFRGNGVASVRYYYSNALSRSDRHNLYRAEFIQLIPAVASTDVTIDDTGGGNTGGVDQGGGISGSGWSLGFGTGYS